MYFPTPVQAFECGVIKGHMLSRLAPHFEKIRIEFVVSDNHSRLTTKPQSKQAGLNSHNYVVGHVGKLVSSGQDNIEFNIHHQGTKVVNVAGRNYLLAHGHDVRGWAGFPYYGIERYSDYFTSEPARSHCNTSGLYIINPDWKF